jgi:hypothetical protein
MRPVGFTFILKIGICPKMHRVPGRRKIPFQPLISDFAVVWGYRVIRAKNNRSGFPRCGCFLKAASSLLTAALLVFLAGATRAQGVAAGGLDGEAGLALREVELERGAFG